MAITFNNASTAGASVATSVQWTHTASGASPYLVFAGASQAGTSLSAVAYNGTTLTKKAHIANFEAGHLWSLPNPNTGSLTMSATFVGSDNFCVGACSYNGVSTATPDGTASTNSNGAALQASISVSTAANMVVFAFLGSSLPSSYVEGTGQTTRFHVSVAAALCLHASEKSAVGASTSFFWSYSAVNEAWIAGIGFSMTAAAAGGNTFTMALLGVGS